MSLANIPLHQAFIWLMLIMKFKGWYDILKMACWTVSAPLKIWMCACNNRTPSVPSSEHVDVVALFTSSFSWQVVISTKFTYHPTSNISRAKSQLLNVSCPVLQLSLPKPLKPGVKSRMSWVINIFAYSSTIYSRGLTVMPLCWYLRKKWKPNLKKK